MKKSLYLLTVVTVFVLLVVACGPVQPQLQPIKVGDVFRGVEIKMVDEAGWGLYNGIISQGQVKVGEDYVWVKSKGGKVWWKYESSDTLALELRYDAQLAYARANGLNTQGMIIDLSDPYVSEMIVPDWGEKPLLLALQEVGYDAELASKWANEGVESLVRAWPEVAVWTDTGPHQYVVGKKGVVFVDFEFSLVGETEVLGEFPTVESYRSYLRRTLQAGIEDFLVGTVVKPPTITWLNDVLDVNKVVVRTYDVDVPTVLTEEQMVAALARSGLDSQFEENLLATIVRKLSPWGGRLVKIITIASIAGDIGGLVIAVGELGEQIFAFGPAIQLPTQWHNPSGEWTIVEEVATSKWLITGSDGLSLMQVWDKAQELMGQGVKSPCGTFILDDPGMVNIPIVTSGGEYDRPSGVGWCAQGSINDPKAITLFDWSGNELVYRFDTSLPMPNWSGPAGSFHIPLDTYDHPTVKCWLEVSISPGQGFQITFYPQCVWR